MNINTDLLQPIVSLILGGSDLAESIETPLPSPGVDPCGPAEPDHVEWVEVGIWLVFYYRDHSFRRIGLVVETAPEVQQALVEYFDPAADRWYLTWIGLGDIRRVIGKEV